MDPFTIIQAGSGIAGALGSLFGGGQNAAAYLQAVMAQRQMALQREIADRQMELATAGSRNARGDSIRYVPGVGWVENLSPQSAAMQGASDAEAMQRYNVDLPRAREGRTMNFARRLDESSAANTALNNYRNVQGRSGDAILNALIERNSAAALDPLNRYNNAVQLSALRTNSSAAQPVAEANRQGAAGLRTAIAEARLAAPAMANEERSGVKGDNLNQYNLLATRASNIDDVPFESSNLASNLSSSADRARAAAPAALYGASTSLARGGGPMIEAAGRFSSPNWGLFAGGVGQSVANLYSAFDDRRQNKNTGWSVDPNAWGSGGYDPTRRS